MNDNAALYSTHNHLQRTDANYALGTYSNLIKFQNDETVLDVGSAGGDLTSDILIPRLPPNFEKVIGLDISDNMVNFANNRYRSNPRVSFSQMDISSKSLPSEFRENFDHIFSFYCLNWVPERRHHQAMKNMYDMLKPGGQIFVTIIANTPIFDVHENMAKMNKWKPFLTNVEDYISVYYHTEEPRRKLEGYLERVGFLTDLCQVEERSYTYPSLQYFWKWAEAINPFVNDLPKSKLGSYIQDYINELRKHNLVTFETDGAGEKIHFLYNFLVACASKPL
ncbi:unnamed protein product [Tenebrio molitor]|nr:unnamed protein product [Tenebrio molitor]